MTLMTDRPALATYLSSLFTSAWGFMTFQHWIAVGGLCIAVVTGLVNWHYKRKWDQREERRLQFEMTRNRK